MQDLRDFETPNWAKLSVEQRVYALQELENSMAQKQGRTSRIVIADDKMPRTRRGQYSLNSPRNLCINLNLLTSSSGNYQLMQTIIHEGRHAYHDDCVRGRIEPLPQDRVKLESWVHNMSEFGGVYNKDGIDYRYQPIETDAFNYARDEMNALSSQFGHDPAYRIFSAAREKMDQETEEYAKSSHGEDYEKKISQDIKKRYEENMQSLKRISVPSQTVSAPEGKGASNITNDRAPHKPATGNPVQQSSQNKEKTLFASVSDISKLRALEKASQQGKSESRSTPRLKSGRER